MKKGTTTDMARRAVKSAKNVGLEVTTYFMLGLPGQKADDVKMMSDFAIELDADYAQFTYLWVLPFTELYSMALKAGAFDHDFFSEFAKKTPNQLT